MELLMLCTLILDSLIGLVLLILGIIWMARILRAMESSAKSLAAAQDHLGQMRTASISLSRHIIGG